MPTAFSIRNLTFTYQSAAKPAVYSVSLKLETGRYLSIMGRSGAGKTTLLYALTAVIPERKKGALKGDRLLFGESLDGLKPRDLAGKAALVFQDFEASLFSTKVRNEVALGPEYLGLPPVETRARISECLDISGLAGFEERRVDQLSGGEKQRLAVAAALAMRAELLLFDEATTDLDPEGKREVSDLAARLARNGHVVVSVESEPEAALAADELLLMSDGLIISKDDPLDILTDSDVCAKAGVQALPFLRLCEKADGTWRLRPGISANKNVYEKLVPDLRASTDDPVIKSKGLTYRYEGGAEALKGVNLTVNSGEIVAILGQNGSGKTTLAKCAAGILKPTAGRLHLLGQETRKIEQLERSRYVGYLFQNPDHQIFSESVYDEIAFGPRNMGIGGRELEGRVRNAMENVAMAGREDEDPFALTKGDRQRIALASILAMEPQIIILDEPTTGLDFEEVRSVMNLILDLNRKGKTIIVITHSMSLVAEYIPRTIIMRDGTVVLDGPTRDVLVSAGKSGELGIEPPLVTEITAKAGYPCLTNSEFEKVFGGNVG